MVRLTELSLPKFASPDDLLSLFNPASLNLNLTFIPTGVSPGDLFGAGSSDTGASEPDLLTNLQATLTIATDGFGNLQNQLPASLDDFLENVFSELKKLGTDSQAVSKIIQELITPSAQASRVFNQFSGLTTLSIDLVPALIKLSNQSVNADTLMQLLPISTVTSLSTQLPTALQPYLIPVEQVQSQIDRLLLKPDISQPDISQPDTSQPDISQPDTRNALTMDLLSEYNAMLQLILEQPANAASLNEAEVQVLTGRIDTQIQCLQDNVQTVNTSLATVQTNLEGLPDFLNALLDQASSQLLPQRLAQDSNFLEDAFLSLNRLGEVDLSTAANKIQAVIQPLQKLAKTGIGAAGQAERIVQALNQGIDLAERAVVNASSLVTNVINQLRLFIQAADFRELVEQAKATFKALIANLNQVVHQVDQVIEQIYTYACHLIEQGKDLGTKLFSMVEKFEQLLNQITSFWEDPQVKQAVQQAKQGINLVAKKLDDVSLKPVFNQILTQVNSVETSLRGVNLSRLNPVLKQSLFAALAVVRQVIDPPIQIQDVIKREYNTRISRPILQDIVYPIKEDIDKVVQLIQQLDPGLWVAQMLIPPYQQAIAAVNTFLSPETIANLLSPLSRFQAEVLKLIDQTIKPKNLLKPLVQGYQKIAAFVQSLQPDFVQARLGQLLKPTLASLESLEPSSLSDKLEAEIRSIIDWLNTIPIDQPILEKGIESVIATWMQQLRIVVDQMDWPGLQTLLQPLRTVMVTLRDQTRFEGTGQLAFVQQARKLVGDVEVYTTQYDREMTQLASTWKQACQYLQTLNPISDELKSQYAALQIRLQSLNPIERLITPTQLMVQLKKTAAAIFNTLKQTWQGLEKRFHQNCQSIYGLLDQGANGFRDYLHQVIDALINQSLKGLIRRADRMLAQLKGVAQPIQDLRQSSPIFISILEQVRSLVRALDPVKRRIQSFDFGFLSQSLQQVKQTIADPLKQLDPEILLIAPLTEIYDKAIKMLQRLDPGKLFTTPRGKLSVRLKATAQRTDPLTLPQGTTLTATTPGRQVWFATLEEKIISLGESVEISVLAIVAGHQSDLNVVEGAIWQVVGKPDLQVDLEVLQSQPILSLVTLVQQEVLGLLQKFDPMQLIAQPLNEQYAKLVKQFNELGLTTLFDVFFRKLEGLDQEIQVGLDQLIKALSGLIAAMPS